MKLFPFPPFAFKRFLAISAVGLIYYKVAYLSLLVSFQNTNASPIWPPSGIAFAAILIFGFHVWPGILLGAFFANAHTFLTNISISNVAPESFFLASFSIAIGNTLEAVIGSILLKRLAEFRPPLSQIKDVFAFILVTFEMCLISATIGPSSLCSLGIVPWTFYSTAWLTWWLGDVTGIFILTPLFLTWCKYPFKDWKWQRFLEFTFLILFCLSTGFLVFSGNLRLSSNHHPISYMFIPIVIWAALRFTQTGVTIVSPLISGMAIWGTIRGFGPFVVEDQNSSFLLNQVFVATVSVTGLVLAALLNERTRAGEALRETYLVLERQVEERTTALRSMNQSLSAEVLERQSAEKKLLEANKSLKEKIQELEILNRIMMDREERILELKEQIRVLQSQLEHQAKDSKVG